MTPFYGVLLPFIDPNKAMPARVECRHGSIFDEKCDLLVIRTPATGMVSPEARKLLNAEGIPLPTAMASGTVARIEFTSPQFGSVAYAATVRGLGATREAVEQMGAQIGKLLAPIAEKPEDRNLLQIFRDIIGPQKQFKVSAPLLGAGQGALDAVTAALALRDGFISTAPEKSCLMLNMRDRATCNAVSEALRNEPGGPPRDRDPAGDTDGKDAPLEASETQPTADVSPTSIAAEYQPSTASIPEEPPSDAAEESQPTEAPAPSRRDCVFISYSHEDAEWLARLQKHLRPLQREGVEVWDDTRLKIGDEWRERLRDVLARTRVAILLISADFIASDFIAEDELPPLLEAASEDGATILPVIISPSRFDLIDSLFRFQAANQLEKPLVEMSVGEREAVLDKVARAVEDALKD